jgi:hypothetical protein
MVQRLARGALDTPGGEASRAVAVYLFMQALARRFPTALDELVREVRHPATRLKKREQPGSPSLMGNMIQVASPALRAWAARWNIPLSEPIMIWAFRAVRYWKRNPQSGMEVRWTEPPYWSSWLGHTTEDKHDPIAPVGALPDLEDRGQFFARAEAHWNARLNALKAQGYEEASLKTSVEHFDWLVRYQCGGESMGRISESAGRTLSSVREGIRAAAKSIQLTQKQIRAPARGGRPPRQKPTAKP